MGTPRCHLKAHIESDWQNGKKTGVLKKQWWMESWESDHT